MMIDVLFSVRFQLFCSFRCFFNEFQSFLKSIECDSGMGIDTITHA